MSCRTCKSYPNCDGCNINTLIKALENGKFDFDEHHNVIIPDKVIHAEWVGIDDDPMGFRCSKCDEILVPHASKYDTMLANNIPQLNLKRRI